MRQKIQPSKNNRKAKLLLTIIIIFVVILGVAQVFLSNRLATLGEDLEQENLKTESLIAANQLLEQELREKESLIAIADEAKKLGFEKIASVYYLTPQVPVAMK